MNYQLQNLHRFTGTEHWYRHPLFAGCLYTDGVRYVAQEGGAYWLIEKIFALQHEPKLRREGFQVWTLKVREDQSAVLTCHDGDNCTLYREKIVTTDFPLKTIRLYFCNRTLLLPSEY